MEAKERHVAEYRAIAAAAEDNLRAISGAVDKVRADVRDGGLYGPAAETRTVAVRVELANPGLLLKPGMFAQVELSAATQGTVVTVPASAVIDSGTRQMVLISQGEGRFEPREVKLGSRNDNYVEVLDGVKDGDKVVVAANFLIDAESNLKAAVGGFGSSAPAAVPAMVC